MAQFSCFDSLNLNEHFLEFFPQTYTTLGLMISLLNLHSATKKRIGNPQPSANSGTHENDGNHNHAHLCHNGHQAQAV